MLYIVTDLEMNQPSGKIIDIGAVLVDLRSGKILQEFSELCNPGELPSNEYRMENGMTVPEFTGITPEMVVGARSLKEVLVDFWKWVDSCQCGRRMAAFGHDVDILKEQSKEVQVEIPQRINVFNLIPLSNLARGAKGGKTKNKGGLLNSLRVFDIKPDGTPHRALPDARNTAVYFSFIFKKICMSFQVEEIINNLK